MCLQFIAFAEPSLTTAQLREAVSAPEIAGGLLNERNIVSEDEISRRCSSLIRKSEDGQYFEFAHFSVKEFLEDETALKATPTRSGLEAYQISIDTGRKLLAKQCLLFIQSGNFSQQPVDNHERLELITERDQKHPFYRYAAAAWLELTEEGLDDIPEGESGNNDGILALTRSLFHPSKTACFSTWAVEIFQRVLTTDKTHSGREKNVFKIPLDSSFRPLHLAAALNLPEVCAFLIDSGEAPNLKFGPARPIDLAMMTILGVSKGQLRYNSLSYTIFRMEVYELLPSAARRNQTLDLLIEKTPEHSPPFSSPSVFNLTCNIAVYYEDMMPIVKLLSLDVKPSASEIDTLDRCLQWLPHVPGSPGGIRLQESALALVQYLKTSCSFDTDWVSRIGSLVWNWAISLGFTFTDDPFLTDSRISLSEEALTTRATTAIRDDEPEVVKRCLADGRLSLSKGYSGTGGTLLHMAVMNMSSAVVKLLLEAGCDPYIKDKKGRLPLYYLANGAFDIIEIFLQAGVSLAVPDDHGCTLWHTWIEKNDVGADVKSKGLTSLYNLDQEGASRAFSWRAHDGNTPLSLALKRALTPDDEKVASTLIDLCGQIPDFWASHDPVFGLAAQQGSEKIVRCLLDAGAPPDAMGADGRSPLHDLGAAASTECCKLLKTLYPDACECKIQGCLPMNLYVQKVLRCGGPLDMEVIKLLLSPKNFANQNGDGDSETTWEWACGLLNFTLTEGLRAGRQIGRRGVDQLLTLFLQQGAMQAYENQKDVNGSGLIPLFSAFVALIDPEGHTRGDLDSLVSERFLDLIRLGVQSTRYWESCKGSQMATKLLIGAIKIRKVRIVAFLLENELDVHRRSNGISTLEYACQHAYPLCSSDEGKNILSQLLGHSKQEKLNDLSAEGYNLLHYLVTPFDTKDIEWIFRELVHRGLNINVQASEYPYSTALTHHLLENSISCANLLLDMGADPTLCSDRTDSYHAFHAAVIMNNADFLERLLETARQRSISMFWRQTNVYGHATAYISFTFYGMNILHLACLHNSTNCLEILFDRELVSDVDFTSAEDYTPLHFTAFGGAVDAMKLLLSQGAGIMTKSNDGRTPLHASVMGGHPGTTELLLERGASETADEDGVTPGLYALDLGHSGMMRVFESAFGADISQMNQSRKKIGILSSAIQRAIAGHDLDACKRLFASGCPIDARMPCLGCSPLIKALDAADLKITMWLLDNGASTLRAACSAHRNPDLNVVELAALDSRLNPVLPRLFKTYIAQGGDIVRGSEYPFYVAVKAGNYEGLAVLLETAKECVKIIA